MRDRRRAPGASPRARAELEGHLEGLAHALGALRLRGEAEPEAEEALLRARAAFAGRRWELLAAELAVVEGALGRRHTEQELTEIPRGLVGYVPLGARGVPPGPEEDALANRRRTLMRLIDLAPLAPERRDQVTRLLRDSAEALVAGDRARARARLDEAHRLLEGG